jgi:CTP-dependent riboflavin kinase
LKLVCEISGNALKGVGIGKNFLSRSQAAQQLREKIDKKKSAFFAF